MNGDYVVRAVILILTVYVGTAEVKRYHLARRSGVKVRKNPVVFQAAPRLVYGTLGWLMSSRHQARRVESTG